MYEDHVESFMLGVRCTGLLRNREKHQLSAIRADAFAAECGEFGFHLHLLEGGRQVGFRADARALLILRRTVLYAALSDFQSADDPDSVSFRGGWLGTLEVRIDRRTGATMVATAKIGRPVDQQD